MSINTNEYNELFSDGSLSVAKESSKMSYDKTIDDENLPSLSKKTNPFNKIKNSFRYAFARIRPEKPKGITDFSDVMYKKGFLMLDKYFAKEIFALVHQISETPDYNSLRHFVDLMHAKGKLGSVERNNKFQKNRAKLAGVYIAAHLNKLSNTDRFCKGNVYVFSDMTDKDMRQKEEEIHRKNIPYIIIKPTKIKTLSNKDYVYDPIIIYNTRTGQHRVEVNKIIGGYSASGINYRAKKDIIARRYNYDKMEDKKRCKFSEACEKNVNAKIKLESKQRKKREDFPDEELMQDCYNNCPYEHLHENEESCNIKNKNKNNSSDDLLNCLEVINDEKKTLKSPRKKLNMKGKSRDDMEIIKDLSFFANDKIGQFKLMKYNSNQNTLKEISDIESTYKNNSGVFIKPDKQTLISNENGNYIQENVVIQARYPKKNNDKNDSGLNYL